MEAHAKCKGCGFSGTGDQFEPCLTAYHDLKCPDCGTTNIDTSAINAEWKKNGSVYGYGDNNCLNTEDGFTT